MNYLDQFDPEGGQGEAEGGKEWGKKKEREGEGKEEGEERGKGRDILLLVDIGRPSP